MNLFGVSIFNAKKKLKIEEVTQKRAKILLLYFFFDKQLRLGLFITQKLIAGFRD